MKVFVWKYVGGMTSNYHSSAGVLVVAETVERARELAEGVAESYDRDSASDRAEGLSRPPDMVWDVVNAPGEQVELFPDAGCC